MKITKRRYFLPKRKIHMHTLSQVTDFIFPYVRCHKLCKPHGTVNITPTDSSKIYETWDKRPTLEGKNNSLTIHHHKMGCA
jgi:hypothetical protein